MENIKFIACDPETSLYFQAVNSHLVVLGEEIETPFIDYIKDGDTSGEVDDYVDINHDLERKIMNITVRPDFDLKAQQTVRLHVPLKWEHRLTIETNNGAIEARQLNGKIKTTTRNGKILLAAVKGASEAACANGSVEVERYEGRLDISTSNGKVTVRDSVLEGGAVKSGNGRIGLQVKPKGSGNLNIFSGNGRIKLALPDEGNYKIRMKTKGKISNHLENAATLTEDEGVTVVKGTGEFSVYIQNFKSGIQLVKFEDFDKSWDETQFNFEFEKEFDMTDFFDNIFRMFKPDPAKAGDWKEELEKMAQRMGEWGANFGDKFGRMGEDLSRQFSETYGGTKNKDDEPVRIILEMLKEGKISVEDAEKLLNAIKKNKS
jgi:hypothetical protein